MARYGYWKPYVPVAQRREQAARRIRLLKKQGMEIKPIKIEGRRIARTFWGKSWCRHLEKFSDYANRLPRGRTYVRNGSVCHLEIKPGVIEAMVMGSRMYHVKVKIKTLPKTKWLAVKKRCAGGIGSLLELLEGRLSKSVMEVVTDRDTGLFPLPREISLDCDCPDWAVMCKHVASVLYGVGARLDENPELLFELRRVKHDELISEQTVVSAAAGKGKSKRKRIAAGDLSDVFGIEITDDSAAAVEDRKAVDRPRRKKKYSAHAKRSKGASTGTRTKRAGTRASSRAGGKEDVRGRDVAALRSKFRMSRSVFAWLLEVSPSTIANWEEKRGRIKFQKRTFEAWRSVANLSRKKAWQQFEEM